MQASRTNRYHWIALGALAALAGAGCATSWPVDPGDPVTLEPSQGLLVVHTQTNRPLRSIGIGRGVRAAEDVPEGAQVRLIGITAGSYRWAGVATSDWAVPYRFRDAERLRFRVEPGVINYVGVLMVGSEGPLSVWINTLDRTAMALEALRKEYPELVAKYPIVYSGPAPHVFLERHRDAIAQRGELAP